MKSNKEELYRKWNEFLLSDGAQALVLGTSLQKYFEEIEKPDAEDYYLWGMSIYTLNQERSLENCHPLFLAALEQDPNYYLARLYSAHCYHDKGQFNEALSEYLRVDQELLAKEMPIWRWVKLLEQIGFCLVKQGQLTKAESYFEKVICAYETMNKNELVPVQEAYECLPAGHYQVQRLKHAEEQHFT